MHMTIMINNITLICNNNIHICTNKTWHYMFHFYLIEYCYHVIS